MSKISPPPGRLQTMPWKVAEPEQQVRLMPIKPMLVTYREAILFILADGRERAESEVLSYFAPEDHGGAASTLVKLADDGEVVRSREPGGPWRIKRMAVVRR